MSSEWTDTTLGAVTEWVSGGTPKKDEPSFWGGDIPWISANSMHGTRYADSDLKLTNAGLVNGSRLAPENSVLLLVRGGALHNRIPVGIATRPVAFNQDVKALIAKQALIRPLYLLYWLMGSEKFLLDSVVEFTGIGAGKLDTRRMQSLEMSLPPLDEQDAVVSVVMALDDRITLLRETNATLEAIAQALFKSWFVDFDPVRAKAEGRQPEGMDATTAALFPDSFEESELGLVPKGWRVVRLGDVTERITKGTTPTTLKRPFVESGINFVKVESITDDGQLLPEKFAYIDDETHCLLGRSQLKADDVLVTIAGTIGRVAVITEDFIPANTNQAVAIVRPDISKLPSSFVNQFLRLADSKSRMGERVVQAVQANLSLGSLSDMRLVMPPSELVTKLHDLVFDSIGSKRNSNQQCIRTLTQLRDTLLPRLISGQLRLPEAEALIEEVV